MSKEETVFNCWVCERKGLDSKAETSVELKLCSSCAKKLWPRFLSLLEVLIEMARERKDKKIPLVEPTGTEVIVGEAK